jgi:hypothetical protein
LVEQEARSSPDSQLKLSVPGCGSRIGNVLNYFKASIKFGDRSILILYYNLTEGFIGRQLTRKPDSQVFQN